MVVPDSAAFLCYACGHEFIPEKVVTPLRISLSYGNDSNDSVSLTVALSGSWISIRGSSLKSGKDGRMARMKRSRRVRDLSLAAAAC